MIDLVVENKDGKYSVTGGPESAIFCGTGSTLDEAIGSWFTQNREAVDLRFSIIKGDRFSISTQYGVGRTIDQLGPNELRAWNKLKEEK